MTIRGTNRLYDWPERADRGWPAPEARAGRRAGPGGVAWRRMSGSHHGLPCGRSTAGRPAAVAPTRPVGGPAARGPPGPRHLDRGSSAWPGGPADRRASSCQGRARPPRTGRRRAAGGRPGAGAVVVTLPIRRRPRPPERHRPGLARLGRRRCRAGGRARSASPDGHIGRAEAVLTGWAIRPSWSRSQYRRQGPSDPPRPASAVLRLAPRAAALVDALVAPVDLAELPMIDSPSAARAASAGPCRRGCGGLQALRTRGGAVETTVGGRRR